MLYRRTRIENPDGRSDSSTLNHIIFGSLYRPGKRVATVGSEAIVSSGSIGLPIEDIALSCDMNVSAARDS